jgi:hypothetical protein
MIKNGALISFALLASLFLFACHPMLGQAAPNEDILQWEGEIARFDSLNLVEHANARTILVTGSSSVRLWESIQSDLAPYQVIQRGYGGAKLTDFNYYVERIINPGPFKAILIFVANDISGVEGDKQPREVQELFKELVNSVRKRNPGTPIFWIETTPTPSRWHASPKARRANELIASYCNKNEDLHFISTFDHYLGPAGLPDSTYFQQDMLHLNRKGYLQWSEIIKSSLMAAGIEP